ncbi:hypothetical protein QQ045_005848 [Rhodiola kirilowii]
MDEVREMREFSRCPQMRIRRRMPVVEGTFPVYNSLAKFLFNTGATHSFIAASFASTLDLPLERFDKSLYVDMPLRHNVLINKMCKGCVIKVVDYDTEIDVILLEMSVYQVILGMDWLSKYRVIMDCYQKKLSLFTEEGKELCFFGEREASPFRPHLLFNVTLLKGDGISKLLISMKIRAKCEQPQCSVPVVYEYLDVFPEELTSLLRKREVDFSIKVYQEPTLISRIIEEQSKDSKLENIKVRISSGENVEELSRVHNVFHVSMLRKCAPDDSQHLEWKGSQLDKDASYEERPNIILHQKDRVLRNKVIPLVKVLWEYHGN